MNRPIIIAEIGCNHMGKLDIAYKMIDTAVRCGVDGVKFQKRNPKELLTKKEYNTPHPNPENSYGSTYGEHREFLELDIEQHKKLKAYCEKNNLIYSTSVWDLTSTKEIVSINPDMIKIPSACNLKFDILDYLCNKYKGEIHLSLGMTTKKEEKQIVEFFVQKNRNQDLVIYSCTSGYPVTFEDICLYEITRLKNIFGNKVKAVGFSGHHLGISADIAAMTLGADYIERHYTLDRTWKGTDHAASLEPDGLRKLVRDVKNVSKALDYKKQDVLEVEIVQRNKLKRHS